MIRAIALGVRGLPQHDGSLGGVLHLLWLGEGSAGRTSIRVQQMTALVSRY